MLFPREGQFHSGKRKWIDVSSDVSSHGKTAGISLVLTTVSIFKKGLSQDQDLCDRFPLNSCTGMLMGKTPRTGILFWICTNSKVTRYPEHPLHIEVPLTQITAGGVCISSRLVAVLYYRWQRLAFSIAQQNRSPMQSNVLCVAKNWMAGNLMMTPGSYAFFFFVYFQNINATAIYLYFMQTMIKTQDSEKMLSVH